MTYKEALTAAMNELAADPLVRFIGYGVRYGARAMGTLKGVRDDQLIETPTAENLMVGVAIGISLRGFKPVVFVERMDFILNAADAIVNHLDKITKLSDGEFRPAAILRVVVGNRDKPLYTGPTHCQNFSHAMRQLVSFPVRELCHAKEIAGAYRGAKQMLDDLGQSTMLVEMKDLL